MKDHTEERQELVEQQRDLLEQRTLDPVTLQVIGGELDTIVNEMGYKMLRSSYSSIIRESEDLGAALFDHERREIAESDYTPMHVGSLMGQLEGMYECFEERGDDPDDIINDGDVFFHNHPYYGATHASDLGVFVPIFYDGELVGWAADTAHLLDIGNATPGIAVDIYDMYGEGQLFKARKFVSEGERVEEMWNHFNENTRTPRMNEGDLQAMISAAKIGRDRYLGLIDEYGLETIQQAGEDLIAYAEDLMRQKIRHLPDGNWHEMAYLDDDGRNRAYLEPSTEEERRRKVEEARITIDVKVRVENDEIVVDLTDSNDQVPTGFNCPVWGTTTVSVAFTLRAILMDTWVHDEYIPLNAGPFRPIDVETRDGSIFDPTPPTSAYARIQQADLMGSLIVKALRNAIPERVMAGDASQVFFTSYSGPDPDRPGEYWMYLEVNDGSYGGRPERDGVDAVDAMIHNTKNRPTEDIELSHPLRVERYELREDGHGAGEHRGGHGIVRETTMLVPVVQSVEGDGRHYSPWGIFGGKDGDGASLWHVEVDDESDTSWYSRRDRQPTAVAGDVADVAELYTKFNGYEYDPGDRHICITPMSGGYGDPYDRPMERVYDDWRDDMITREIAERDYGVVITEDGTLDERATRDLRSHAD